MPACLSCGMTAPSHFANCPAHVTDELVTASDGTLSLRRTANHDTPICGPAILNDRLDRIERQVAERSREW